MIHMEAMGVYVKEIGCVSGLAMGWQTSNYCVLPRRKYTTFRTQRKFEIKMISD